MSRPRLAALLLLVLLVGVGLGAQVSVSFRSGAAARCERALLLGDCWATAMKERRTCYGDFECASKPDKAKKDACISLCNDYFDAKLQNRCARLQAQF